MKLLYGVDIDFLHDRWGQSYRFEFGAEGRNFYIRVRSGGPNGRFDAEPGSQVRESDDFIVSTCFIEYTAEISTMIRRALTTHFIKMGLIPQNESELREVLKQSGINFDELRDGWDRRFYTTFKTTSQSHDRVTQFDQAQYGGKPQPKTEITPVTRQLLHINIWSAGADGKERTADDFVLTEYSQVIAEVSAKQIAEKSSEQSKTGISIFSGVSGGINGTVMDENSAVISNATVTAKRINSESVLTMKTSDQGTFLLSDLTPGIYDVRFESVGFKVMSISGVVVYSLKLTKLDVRLNAGTVTETVTVSAGAPSVLMTSSSVATVRGKDSGAILGTGSQAQITTPRLRQYFPETLLWQPQLETDKQGRAQLRLKLADNITTWKVSVVGSTVDGEIGLAEKEFSAFQPFFTEHDPPKVLTAGDEISLPVVLRNYLAKAQSVSAEIKPESWFELLSPGRKQVEIKTGNAGQVVLEFRTIDSVEAGKKRMTVFGSGAGDAVEKPVGVHPDGEEITTTVSTVFTDSGVLEVGVPEAAIKGSVRAELKIYPNLMAHAMEGIEGILRRPYGCAEQTISSSYPNVMVLRYLESQGELLAAPMRKIAESARRYTQAGYERLLGYRTYNGGFSYWGRDDADTALTAYALRFLNDARSFIKIDEEVIEEARKYLIDRQQIDGRWASEYWGWGDERNRSAFTTAFITRVLAMERGAQAADKALAPAVRRALDYLANRIEEIEEPYLIASYALAAIDAGEKEGTRRATAKLRALAREEAGYTYWNLESETPFYGWGMAGKIETTALAVKALKKSGETSDGRRAEALTDQGLLFLIRNKDRYGVWHSTQATINALDTLIGLNDAEKSGPSGKAEIFVNGKRAGSVIMPQDRRLLNPMVVDLSPFLSRGKNRVEIRRSGDGAQASAQIVETHYELWEGGAAKRRENVEFRNATALRLKVNY